MTSEQYYKNHIIGSSFLTYKYINNYYHHINLSALTIENRVYLGRVSLGRIQLERVLLGR